jgi:hypothetical protein
METLANSYCTATNAGIVLQSFRLQGRQLFREGSRFSQVDVVDEHTIARMALMP